jgi:hypothetical protein
MRDEKIYEVDTNGQKIPGVNFFIRLSVQRRTTFCEIHLFSDDLFQHETSFIYNRKEWGVGSRGERLSVRGCER